MNIMMFCSNPVDGGTAKIFFELVSYFEANKSGRDKIFACVNKDNPVEIYKKIDFLDRIEVYSEEELFEKNIWRWGCVRIASKIIRNFKYTPIKKKNVAIMREYLKKNKIDCLVIHNGGYVGDDLCNQMLEAAYGCADQVICRILVFHNDFEKNFFSKLRFRNYDKLISKYSSELVTVSNYTKKRLLSNSFINKDIQVIYNGLSESNKLTEEQKRNRVQTDNIRANVLMIGNFQRNKGQIEFIKAAKILHEMNEEIRFTIIGNNYDNLYYDECISKIQRYGLTECISIYHGINNAAEYIDLFNVIAVPSMYDESFGLISVEAMSKGVPVVAFSCGGIPEVVIDGRNGYIVPLGNSTLMAEKIAEILTKKENTVEFSKNCCIDFEKRFSLEAMGKQYYKIIDKYRTGVSRKKGY